MLDTPRWEVAWEYWLPTLFASFPFTSPPVRHRVPPGSERALHLKGRSLEQCICLKYWLPPTRLQGVLTQTTTKRSYLQDSDTLKTGTYIHTVKSWEEKGEKIKRKREKSIYLTTLVIGKFYTALGVENKIWVWSTGGMVLLGENRGTWRETFSSANLLLTNPTQAGLE